MKTADVVDLDKAKLDPGSVFHAPKDVLAASGLAIEDKKAILMRWEADADSFAAGHRRGYADRRQSQPCRTVARLAFGDRDAAIGSPSVTPRNSRASSHVLRGKRPLAAG